MAETPDDSTRSATALDEAFTVSLQIEGSEKAYPWLVRAHIHHHGWARYWSSQEKNEERLQRATKHYGDRWQDYVKDTSKQTRYWERRKYDFTIGTSYLIQYLLLLGEITLAKNLARVLLKIFVEEVSDQPIPPAAWLK